MSKPTVLLVEDDKWLRDTFVDSLEKSGLQVETADHALAAIEMLDRLIPDVLVLDIFLPGPNGLLLLHEMRSHQDLGSIPAVVVTTSAEHFSEEDLEAYGVVRVLDKTVMKPGDIATAVRKALL